MFVSPIYASAGSPGKRRFTANVTIETKKSTGQRATSRRMMYPITSDPGSSYYAPGVMFDVIVRGGRVVDPSQGIDAVTDVGIIGQRVAAIGTHLVEQGVRGEVVDATGLLVTPGWVDLHTHVYWGVAPLGVEADPNCLRRGVTTAVDAGSAGASTFPGFKRYVIDVSLTRVVAMLNLSALGMAHDAGFGGEAVGELEDIRWANVERALEVARAYSDVITGIKIRLGRDLVGHDADHSREVLRRARQVADAIGKPVM